MKREGRLNGTVVRSNGKVAKVAKVVVVDSSPVPAVIGGNDIKLGSKPTNASKFTGKCRKARCKGCHYQPVNKAKDKGKGTYKDKSRNDAISHRILSWRVVDEGGVLDYYNGISATALLGHMSENCSWHDEQQYGDDYYDYKSPFAVLGSSVHEEDGQVVDTNDADIEGYADGEEQQLQQQQRGDEDEDGDLGFYMVGIALEFCDEEDWLVVEEIM